MCPWPRKIPLFPRSGYLPLLLPLFSGFGWGCKLNYKEILSPIFFEPTSFQDSPPKQQEREREREKDGPRSNSSFVRTLMTNKLPHRIDNSEWMRNGDFTPSRLEAQNDCVTFLFNAKTSSNPENTVGLVSLAGKRFVRDQG
jgi:hypothetical protein